MSAKTRIALLGVQHYHANFWAKAFASCDTAEVVGVWDSDETIAAGFATDHGLTHVTDRAALLDDCDAVAICSTTIEHGPLIRAAADAGRAILCEKPLAVSASEGEAIAAHVAKTGVPFMQSFPKRLDPATVALRDIVASGDLGDLTMIRVRHGHSHGLNPDFRTAWFVDPAKSGGGTLLDEGIHAADFLRFVFGEPARVSAAISSATLNLPVEDTALATFEYEGGPIAEIATGWCFAAADDSIEIYGTKGTALLSGVDIASRPTREAGFLRVFRNGAWDTDDIVPRFKTGVFHEHVAWTFAEALATGAAMPTGPEDGLRAFAMIDAAYGSARDGVRRAIDWPDPA